MPYGHGTTSHARRGAIFLTGATGFLGMELLARYLDRTGRHVYALVRSSAKAEPAPRLHGVVETLTGGPDATQDRPA
jgi:thioester reductase-like protein